MKLKQKYLKVLEQQGWTRGYYVDANEVELRKFSPAGEDFSIIVNIKNFPESVMQAYEDYDADEHVEIWLNAKRNGIKGIPSTRRLVQDAEDIEEMLKQLAGALL